MTASTGEASSLDDRYKIYKGTYKKYNMNITGIRKPGHPLRYLMFAFVNAKNRCKPTYKQHKDYYDRGIEFKFASLQEWVDELGLRPTSEHSVDRIDNYKGYESGNVRWATKSEQMSNKRARTVLIGRKQANNTSGYLGVSWHKKSGKWAAQVKKDRKTYFCGCFTDVIEAAKARDKKSLELFGHGVKLNFPHY
jgi:hypothetical protein